MTEITTRGPRVNPGYPTATWEIEDRWGREVGDVRTYAIVAHQGRVSIHGLKDLEGLKIELVRELGALLTIAAEWLDDTSGGDRG